jgi:hypothetical protein
MNSPTAARRQDHRAPPPCEHHDLLADDKSVFFEVVPLHRLAGTWQGPGRICDLRRHVQEARP